MLKRRNTRTSAAPPATTDPWAVHAARANQFMLLALLGFAAAAFFAFLATVYAGREADFRVAFVKLDPNGNFQVEFFDEDAPVRLFQNTVESLLKKAVETRFRQHPQTMRADFNVAALFMGDVELSKFLNEFRAQTVLREYAECGACPIVEPVFRGMQHVESAETLDLLDGTGRVYRSVLYFNFETRSRSSGGLIRSEPKLVPVTWMLDRAKIAAAGGSGDMGLRILDVNPIGLTILSYGVEDDLGGPSP